MKLVNKGRNEVISRNLVVYNSFFQKLRGLMFKKDFQGVALFPFNKETRFGASIHTFFVFFGIDVFWLDSNKVVVDAARVKPFAVNKTPRKPSQYFLEAKANTLDIEIGNKLDWY